MILLFDKQAQAFELFYDSVSSIETSLTLERTGIGIQRSVVIQDVYERDMVSFPEPIVIEIVCRGKFDRTRPEIWIDIRVRYDFQESFKSVKFWTR